MKNNINIPEVKVDFRQLLEDIDYTNKVTKAFDVSDIITRTQYYELKDRLVLWLLRHNFTETTFDGLEYTTGKYGDKVELVKFTVSYEDTVCKLHQNLDRKTREIFGITGMEDICDEYVREEHDVEFDETRFRECITRMKVTRMKFLRETMDNNNFWQSVCTNDRSAYPWMRVYLKFLPNNGNTAIWILDKNA